MNFKIGKYEFENKQQFKDRIEAFCGIDEEGNKVDKLKFVAVELGSLVLKDGVVSEKYHVDIIFYDIDHQPEGWASFLVDVDGNGSHSFAGLNYNDYKF